MAVYEILPETNLKMEDVRDTLNANGGATDNTMASYYKEAANINVWSFRKPYATDLDMFKLTDEQIRSVNCGLTPYQIASYTSLPDAMDGGMNGWTYELPSGGTNSPFRIGDFAGYKPSANPMIQDFYVPEQASNQFEGNTISASALVNISNGESVSLSDLSELADYYPAVYIVQDGGTQYRRYTGTTPISEGSFSVNFDVYDLTTGTWTVYPFLAKEQIPETYDVVNTYYTIPNVSSKTLEIVSSYATVSLQAIKSSDETYSISWSVLVTNKSSSAITFNTNCIYLRYSGYDLTDSMQTDEKMQSLNDGLVAAANTTTTIASGTFENVSTTIREWDDGVLASLWTRCKVWVSLGTGNYIGSVIPMEESISPYSE